MVSFLHWSLDSSHSFRFGFFSLDSRTHVGIDSSQCFCIRVSLDEGILSILLVGLRIFFSAVTTIGLMSLVFGDFVFVFFVPVFDFHPYQRDI